MRKKLEHYCRAYKDGYNVHLSLKAVGFFLYLNEIVPARKQPIPEERRKVIESLQDIIKDSESKFTVMGIQALFDTPEKKQLLEQGIEWTESHLDRCVPEVQQVMKGHLTIVDKALLHPPIPEPEMKPKWRAGKVEKKTVNATEEPQPLNTLPLKRPSWRAGAVKKADSPFKAML